MRQRTSVASIVVGLCLLTAGCGAAAEEEPPTTVAGGPGVVSNLGGDGLPVQQVGESYGHQSRPLEGTFTLESNGCWTANLGDADRLVVFPIGYTRPLDDGSTMQSPDGMLIRDGMGFDATGGIVPAAGFPGVPDGYWGNYLAMCDPVLGEFLVVDSIAPAFRPENLDTGELSAMLEDANLEVSWGCGIGFAISSADQRVALFVRQTDFEVLADSPVIFPDSRWQGEVVIGKNLLIYNCNDAIEGWIPQPVEAVRWALVGGTLDFEAPPGDSLCSGGDPVTATLHGAQVETPLGIRDLGDLDMVNTAYGCFAG